MCSLRAEERAGEKKKCSFFEVPPLFFGMCRASGQTVKEQTGGWDWGGEGVAVIGSLFFCQCFVFVFDFFFSAFCPASWKQRMLHGNRWPNAPRKNCQWLNVSILRSSLIQNLCILFSMIFGRLTCEWSVYYLHSPRPPQSAPTLSACVVSASIARKMSERLAVYLNTPGICWGC